MPTLVRPLQPADAPAVLTLERTLGEWFNAEGLAAMKRDLAIHHGIVIEENGRVVAFATWRPADDGAADLSWMGVERTRHRHGLGTVLLEALLDDVRRAGHVALEVSTVADSCDYEPYERTRSFYRARGFHDHRIDPGFYGSPEDRYDRLVLRRAT